MISITKKPTSIFKQRIKRIKIISNIGDEIDRNKNPQLYDEKILLLNGLYLVNIVAFWQVFIENMVTYGCNLIKKSITTKPEELLYEIVCNKANYVLKKFNTPDRDRINKVFYDCFGIEKITECWRNGNGNFMKEYNVLNEIINERHYYVHTGKFKKINLSFEDRFKDSDDIFVLAVLLESAIIDNLREYKIN
ncbi:hypothetical protein GOB93_04955 [Acetobacter musti]|uniref:RiboL-PSP-HEPN domain-containing protein n=1 Tax=Acetobacter musti TaxID=864732 RepID=A0ABX0JNB9_9PROT|nr:hypothetical protein [Acetobacter musti]